MTDATWINYADGGQPLRGHVPRPAPGIDFEVDIHARAKHSVAGDPDTTAAVHAQVEALSWAHIVGLHAGDLGASGHG